ncbi:hypothetical protein Tsubulata_004022 [Turnera subulata]|uniref:F-box domain-containing protein n=1 Tax=Turnera subulata TaxID=218843 RepID=A0A9Q0GAA5_9ROSI|nr:hypothetical protein Tsubulata_004022 [Turnera subulata]
MGANHTKNRKLMLQPTTTTMEVGNPTVAASSIQELPDSLLMEILLRLPSAKFAFQCQLVCKNWRSLMSTPFFLKSLKDRLQNGFNNIMAYDLSEPERCNIITMPEDPAAMLSRVTFGVYQGFPKESLRVLQLSVPAGFVDALSYGVLRVWELEEYHSGKWSIKGKAYNNVTVVEQEVAGEEEEEEEEVEEVAGELEEEDEEEELLEEHRRGQWSFKGEAYWKEIIYDDAILKKELESDRLELYPLSLDPYDEDIVQFATARYSDCIRVYSCNLRTKEVKLVDGTIPPGDYVEDAFQIPVLRHCPSAIPRIS